MYIKKSIYIIPFTIISIIVACTNFDKHKKDITAVFYFVNTNPFDSKIFIEKADSHPQMLCFFLEIKNISKQPIFIPIKTLLDTTYKSFIYFLYQGKILYPFTNHTISNCIIPPGETMKVQLTLFPIDFIENDLEPPISVTSIINKIDIRYKSSHRDTSIQIQEIRNLNIVKEENIKILYRNPESAIPKMDH